MAECVPVVPDVGSDWLEKSVIAGFRVWQLMFMSGAGATVVIVLMCCFMKCRVPRTKQEIEADCHRRELTLQFRKQLNKIAMEDVDFIKALDKVRVVFEHEEEKRQRGSWDSLLEQEGEGKELSLKHKLRKLMRIFRFKKKKKEKDKEAPEGEGGKSASSGDHQNKEAVTNSTATEGARESRNSPTGEDGSEETLQCGSEESRKDNKNKAQQKKDQVEIDVESNSTASVQHKK